MIILYPIYAEDKKTLNPWIYSAGYLTSTIIHHNPVLTSNCQTYSSRRLQYVQLQNLSQQHKLLHITLTYVKMRYNFVV
jgi:hypothetical protein